MALSEALGQRHNENMSKKPVRVVAAVFYQFVQRSGKAVPMVGLFRRATHLSGAGSWEFPGGKLDPGETDVIALKREISEELGIQIKVEELVGSCEHDYGNKFVELVAYMASPLESWDQVQWKLSDHDAQKWVGENEVVEEELAPADRPLIRAAFENLKRRRTPPF